MLLCAREEMRELDRRTIVDLGVPGVALMETAGLKTAERIRTLMEPRSPKELRICVYAGPGNNGGDGFVVARHFVNWGARVWVISCTPGEQLTGEALVHFNACSRSGALLLDGTSVEALDRARAEVATADVVVDALFGTGLQREVTGHFAHAISAISGHRGVRVSVDIPSGLDANSGQPLGSCVRADHTVTFAFLKVGLVVAPGFTYVGRLHLVDIGIPERLGRAVGLHARLLDESVLAPLQSSRSPLGHKGTYGHVLLWCGSLGKSGAALLCAQAAIASGAGLATLAAPRVLQPSVDGRIFEMMTAWYDAPDVQLFLGLLAGKRALVVGPGMPTDEIYRPVLRELATQAQASGVGLVLDADALNHLAADASILPRPDSESRTVLTPHPGEAARLLGVTVQAVQQDRVASARALAKRYMAVAVLKGARTIVARPDGMVAVNPTGNAGLASGGTGDVLAGCIGALLGQGFSAFDAACAAVFLHGRAGDRLAEVHGQAGVRASALPSAFADVLTK
jgi:NAD(P)H-hydrate epimerase